jgi:hypothetical protein
MKITKRQLRKIILEEQKKLLSERSVGDRHYGLKLIDYKIGDIIRFKKYDGSIHLVRVTDRDDDMKGDGTDRSGFDGVFLDGPQKGEDMWGYDTQVRSVEK